MSDQIVTLGNPTLYLMTTPATRWCSHYANDFSHVSFSFIAPAGVVTLYSGFEPRLHLTESGIAFDLRFDPTMSTVDLALQIERIVLEKTNELIQESDIKITLGAETSLSGYHYLQITHNSRLKGFWSDPRAIVHKDWFEPDRVALRA